MRIAQDASFIRRRDSLPDPASNIVENIKKTHSTIPKPSPRIQTEQSSGTIERFLGLVYVPNGDTQIGTFNDDQLLCLLKFTRQIGSTQLYTKLLTSFRGCSFSRPVEVIDYAIDREDWEMARQGMTLISNPSYQFYKRESFGAWLESKPEAWQVAIMRALLYKSGTDNVPDHWGSCADGLMRPPDMKRKDA